MNHPANDHAAHVLQQAFLYASLGWKIVPTHGIRPDGSCTCGHSHAGSEKSRGKHPTMSDWGAFASSDEETVGDWFLSTQGRQWNVGVLLGPQSGIIDIEHDTDEGKATAERLFAGTITATYRSGRSIHRFFRWSPALPDVQKIVGPIVGGLEIRIGGGGRQTLSVLPPSRHWSGCTYDWLPGMGPDEVPIAEVPSSVLAMISSGEVPGTPSGVVLMPNGATRARQPLVVSKIAEGERNLTLHAFACREAFRSPNIGSPIEEADLQSKVWAVNLATCDPPLAEEEVVALVASAIRYAKSQPSSGTQTLARTLSQSQVAPEPKEQAQTQQETAAEASEEVKPPEPESLMVTAPAMSVARHTGTSLSDHGLAQRNGWWTPGNWSLRVILGNPPTYRLTVPAWADYIGDGLGEVVLSIDEFEDAAKMAKAVLRATKTVILETRPRLWSSIWLGTKDYDGLRSMLLAACHTESPPVSEIGHYRTAEWLLEQLEKATEVDAISETGTSVEKVGEHWLLRWSIFWRRPIEQGVTTQEQVKQLAQMMGWDQGRYKVRKDKGGNRRLCLLLGAADIARLQKIVVPTSDV